MQAFNANSNGSPQYLYKSRKSLESLMEQLGMPTIWFTLSMADNHWHDLHSMFQRNKFGHAGAFPEFATPSLEAKWKQRFV